MANSVYDPETRQPKKSTRNDEFDKLVDKNFSAGDKRMMEERAIKGAEADKQKSQKGEAEAKEESDSTDLYNPAATAQAKTDGSVVGKLSGKGGFFKRLRKRKKGVLIASGIVGGIILGGLMALFGLLNLLKMDHLISNIDNRVYSRLLAANDHRSSKWFSAYVRMRMLEVENPDISPGERDNAYFRATRVDNNKPLTDWYRTMRASNFEQRLYDKYGIQFTSVLEPNADGVGFKKKAGILKISAVGAPFTITDAELTKLRAGDTSVFNGRLRVFVESETVFNNNKEARQAIKKIIRDETRWWQVIKRRTVRKAIFNMTGVREWRFFETTRDKVQDKRTEIRDRLINKAIPESTKSGKWLKCVFGINDCKAGDDTANKENQDASRDIGTLNPDSGTFNETGVDADGNPITTPHTYDPNALLKSIVSKVTGRAVPVIGWVGLIDTVAKVDKNIEDGTASKAIVVARGVQAMGLYQVLSTSRDQIKPGELTSGELNSFMQILSSAGSSEAWSSVVSKNGKKVDSKKMSRQEYCSEEHQAKIEDVEKYPDGNKEFHYVCENQRIGSANNAQKLEESYNKSVGRVVGPIADQYRSVKDAPIIGKVISGITSILDFFSDIVGDLFFKVAGILGFADDIEKAMAWVFGKLAAFLGGGPIMTGYEPGGVFINWALQGGAFTAETTARLRGAAALTPVARADSVRLANEYAKDELEQQGWYDKFASISNPNSILSTSLFSISESSQSVGGAFMATLGGVKNSIGTMFLLPFSAQTTAEAVDPDAAANFSQIQKYDWPQQCYDLDPLNTTPAAGTNIMNVLNNVTEDELTWDLVTNSDSFYAFVYDKIDQQQSAMGWEAFLGTSPILASILDSGSEPTADDVAKKIWNCHLLDTSVRGGLGYLYGYKEDDGLQEAADADGETPPADADAGTVAGEGGQRIAATAEAEFARNGNKVLETCGQNCGPEVQKYTGGPSGPDAPWCAWFVSWVYRAAGYQFKGSPAAVDGDIPAVVNLAAWFRSHGIFFTPSSTTQKPQPGDVIMYNIGSSGQSTGNEHTGIVVKVTGDTIETVEGNTSSDNNFEANGGTVGRKSFNYKTYSSRPIAFGRLSSF